VSPAPKRVIGFRAEPRLIHWAVLDGTQKHPTIHAQDKINAPASADESAILGMFRERARHLFTTYTPDAVGIRSAELSARGSNKDGPRRRLRVEGVLLEASHSWNLPVTMGALGTISSKLDTKRAKKYLESGQFRGLDLKSLPGARREAVLVAVGLLSKGDDEEEP
jgi:hypothetical protein